MENRLSMQILYMSGITLCQRTAFNSDPLDSLHTNLGEKILTIIKCFGPFLTQHIPHPSLKTVSFPKTLTYGSIIFVLGLM